MKLIYSILFMIILSLPAFGLFVYPDTCIDMKYYKVYYSYKTKCASFCEYKLYKGGGDVSRKGMIFTGKFPHFNYTKSGYDRGHLVPAEDFAYDYFAERSTFNYVNCCPLTPKLNRGKWKYYENKVRQISQTDSVIVFVGTADFNSKGIPSTCWKYVYSLTNKKLLLKIYINQKGLLILGDPSIEKFISNKNINDSKSRK